MNYFEILEIPLSYEIDEQRITEVYLKKQRILHPDMGEKSSDDLDISLLNEAYRVLRNPILRAEYFLKLQGIDPDAIVISESASEILSLREQYESINSEVEIEKFTKHLLERKGDLIDSLYKLENNLEEFNKKFTMLRFIVSFLDRIMPDAYGGN
ncbi:MAG: Fe-S protein assembly co-chaperone HscB [Holosporaceae bacterium]|jgi:molecular chaperone HscB|nr:Fe-S protein assembly co-chaperone HscB [Holosporaceae bacterium]